MATPEHDFDATPFLPERLTLPALRASSRSCRGCPLWLLGTQTVFGAGTRNARLMLVGEQPGDQEDKAGRPFVGPAGALLDRGLEQAGIARADAYVTNVVKHFKWVEKGKRRIHQKPGAREIRACMPWLEAELAVVRPRVLVALGATAAQALLGRSFRVSRQRGEWIASPLAPLVTATVHPSAILRARTDADRRRELDRFVDDLRMVATALSGDAVG